MIHDGLSNTLLIGENVPESHPVHKHSAAYFSWGAFGLADVPLNYFPDSSTSVFDRDIAFSFRSLHGGGVNFCVADGSVHFISETIDYDLYKALATKSEREVVVLP